jgi:uncharacterized repeat protein (TIGR01451 family)
MSGLRRSAIRRRIRDSRRRQLFCEVLEDRRVLSVFIVDSVDDEPDRAPGDGQALTINGKTTLRAAIMEANATQERDTITFNISGDGPHVILPAEALPTLTEPIIIDGYLNNSGATPNTNSFEQGSNANLNIVLDGTLAPKGTNGLTIEGGESIVRGLVIRYFRQDPGTGQNGFGIALGVKGGNRVEGNFIGTDEDGLAANPNTSGIVLASANNTVGGLRDADRNVISGNMFNGIQIGSTRDGTSTGGNDNRILGNYLGTTATGNRPLPNDNGIRITTIAGWNTIGGTTSGSGNVLSGNRFQGILIDVDASGYNVVQGNFIGTDPTGNVTDPDGTPDSGDELGNRDDGIDISGAPHNVIGGPTREAGNVISGNKGAGVLISLISATENVVQNNRIGTNAAGTFTSILAHMGNGGDGVQIQNASGNRVEDNLISNNEQYGVGIFHADAARNLVQGNLIGTDVTGSVAMGNQIGVAICDAPGNFIGGTRPNVVSGNDLHGVQISGVGASGNFIQGNYIGTDVTGSVALANLFDGVRITNAPRNYVGGSTAVTHNLISSNRRHGVHISGTGATGNVILNNTIGLDLTGENELGNTGNGVLIDGASTNSVGLGSGTRNVISGNHESGILIQGENGHDNVVSGNFVGTNRAGTVAIGNHFDGISLVNAISTTIGGDRETAGNLISGNGHAGVSIEGGSVNFVHGNRIGTDIAVTKPLANLLGVEIEDSDSNQIGGVHAVLELCNVISGNLFEGIIIHGSEASGNIVNGNNIGTNTDATAALPNGSDGIKVSEAFGNEIGLPSTSRTSNVIAGNLGFGVYVVDTSDTRIQNNLIGIGNGDVALPNILGGVFLFRTEDDLVGGSRELGEANVISGNAAGPGVRVAMSHDSIVRGNFIGTNVSGTEPRPNLLGIKIEASWNITVGLLTTRHENNLISGNITEGILIDRAWNNAIRGNVIGLNLTRETALPNGGDGVRISNSWDNVIGVDADRDLRFQNVISGNLGHGLFIEGALSQRNAVGGNFIGTDGEGLLARGNGQFGVFLEYASHNVIGGVRNPEGNLISGQRTAGGLGIRGGHDNIVQGNFIGTDYEGAGVIPNLDGVVLEDAYENWIGVSPGLLTPDRGNLISGNSGSGVILEGITHDNRVMGNQIGVQKDGVNPLRNEESGVMLDMGAFDNWIGWTGEADANTIAFNGGSGVVVASEEGNVIRGNSIHDNAVLGIDLNDDGITVNDSLDSDDGANRLTNFPNLTWANAGTLEIAGTLSAKPFTKYEIDFYSSPQPSPFGFGQGQSHLSSIIVTTNHLGRAVFSAPTPQLAVGDWITATAGDADGNTSEFSAGVLVSDDSDDDGVGDDVESKGPHGGDGNQDGIPDSQQPNVATLLNLLNGAYTTLVADLGAALQEVQAVSNPAPDTTPPGLTFNLGLFSFRIVLPLGVASTAVTMIPSTPVTSNDYFQYGPTPDNPTPHWYQFLYDGTTGAEIIGGTLTNVVLHYVDGLRGDHDLTVNGEITDPGGPATRIAPGLRISGDAGPLPAFVGQTFGYSLTVTNHSPDAVADVTFTDTLPRGVHLVSAIASNGAPLTHSAGIIASNLGPLASGQSVDVLITTRLTEPGEIVNTATVAGNGADLDLNDNTISLVTRVSPAPMTIPRETDLAVTQSVTPDPVGVGGDLTYSFTVTNDGPDAARGVVLTDALPADVQLVSVTASRDVPPPDNQPLRVRFDYSYDTGYYDPNTWEYYPPFFEDQERRDLLELAADLLLTDVRDDLDAIEASGDNHWVATFTDPSTGNDVEVPDLYLEENALVIYVGSRDLDVIGRGGMEGGEGGPGGSRASGTNEFITAVQTRGERGARAESRTDFGPWGGSIAFNANPAMKYHFGETLLGLDADELDFITVAMHELAHVLGIGTSPSWDRYVDPIAGTLVGPASRIEYDLGGEIPLDETLGHWLTGTTDEASATLMDPIIVAGTREWPTPLDLAALRDVGWGDEPQSISVPIPYSLINGVLSFDVGNLEAGQSVTMTVVVTPTLEGTAINNVTVSGADVDLDATNNSAHAVTLVTPCPPLVVNTTWDIDDRVSDGRVTSLREAIRLANLLPGKDTIRFAIPSSGSNVYIGIHSALPTITDPVVIDGTTQAGYTGAPVVYITGYFQRSGPNGLHITSGDSTIRGLSIGLYHEFYSSGSITQDNAILLEDGDGNVLEGNVFGSYETSAGVMMIRSDGNRIGGTTAEARNVISSNYSWGILAYESHNNIIQGNYIGTDASGQLANYGNGTGIAFAQADHNQVGGTEPGAGNVISGNRGVGVEISLNTLFTNASHNTVEGNYIGIAADGFTPLGNGSHGIAIWLGNHDNTIGGRDLNAGNTIAFNGGAGVLYGNSNANTPIVGNAIHSNAGLGIDRGPLGVTENAVHYWAHYAPNFPTLFAAFTDADSTRIRGILQGLPNTSFQIDFYVSVTPDPSGHGEADEWLGSATVTTDVSGLAPFYLSISGSTIAGQYITATSTQHTTSEFSGTVVVLDDRDRDGVADIEEDGGPNLGDANRDSAQDSGQEHVATLRTFGDREYINLQAPPDNPLQGIWAIANPSPGNSPYAIPFPLGFLEGAVVDVSPGGSTSLTLSVPAGTIPHGFFHFGTTAETGYDHWYDFAYDGTTGVEVFSDRIVLHLLDGGRGDQDLETNGRIAFLGGVSGPPAMHVVATAPALNDISAPTTTQVSATFGVALDPATVTDRTLVVHMSHTGQLTAPNSTVAVDQATATLIPAQPFQSGELVQVTATGGIRSADGDVPQSGFVWQFHAAVEGGTGVFAQSDQVFSYPQTRNLAIGDLDGDGDLDAFFVNYPDKPNTVWLNNGQGRFTDTGQRFGSYGYDVALGDLDGDGDLDAVVGSFNARVWLNDGQGYFSDGGQVSGSMSQGGVALGDLDGDGDLDLLALAGDNNANGNSWLNDGQAHFTHSTTVGTGWSIRDAALGDLDGDGDLDAFVVKTLRTHNEANGVWLNDGQGILIDSNQRLGSLDSRAVALGDFDGDGDLDAVVASFDGETTIWLNDGHGHFTDSGQSLGQRAINVVAGDFDGDGDLDALLVTAHAGTGGLWLNDGQGRFQAAGSPGSHLELPTTGGGLAAGDLDGDGDLDAIAANCGAFGRNFDTHILLQNDGHGVFVEDGYQQRFEFDGDGQWTRWETLLGDLDGDGDLDAAVSQDPGTAIWFNDGSGHYHDSGQRMSRSMGNLGDLDADGDLDLLTLVAGDYSYAFQMWTNDGSGFFSYAGEAFRIPWAHKFSFADLDGDGDQDIVIMRADTLPTQIWLNDGLGHFHNSGQGLSAYPYVVSDFSVGDLDSDGDLDILLVNNGTVLEGTKYAVWLNDGYGRFTVSGPSFGFPEEIPRSTQVGDLDGDGDLDLFTTTTVFVWTWIEWSQGWYQDHRVHQIWLNDGQGHFTANGQRMQLGTPYEMYNGLEHLADLDGDGDLDILVAGGYTTPYAMTWINDGAGRFAEGSHVLGQPWGQTSEPLRLTTGDLDGDHDLDAIVMHGDHQLLWLNQNPEQIDYPPTAVDDGYTVVQNSLLAIPSPGVLLNDSDPDGDSLVATLVNGPAWATFFEFHGDGSFSYTPQPGFSGPDSFTYQACDPQGIATTATVSVWVVPAVATPIARDDFATSLLGGAVAIDVLANDSDRNGPIDPTTLVFLTDPTLGQVSVDIESGIVTYEPLPGFTGIDQFIYQIAGPTGLTDTAVVTVEILPGNAPPAAANDYATTDEGVPIDIDVLANDVDPDGNVDRSSLRIPMQPAHGTASIEWPQGTLRYRPDIGFAGEEVFTYEIFDTAGASSRAVVTLTVLPVSDSPQANDDVAETHVNAAVAIPILANDLDYDQDLAPDTVRILSNPQHGQVTVDTADGSVIYEPDPNFVGCDTLTYLVCDSTGLCDDAAIHIQVTNSTPVALDDDATTQEATEVILDLAANDVDSDGNLDPLSVRILIQPLGGTVAIDPQTGFARYTPLGEFNGDDLFVYEISDSTGVLGPPAIGLAHVKVTPVDDPPEARNDNAITQPDTPVSVRVLSNDQDVDSTIDVSTVSIEDGPDSGSVTVEPDGSVRYTPEAGFAGIDEFAYTVRDETGARSNVGIVTIEVRAEPAVLIVGRVFEDLDQEDPARDGPGIPDYLVYLLDGQGQLLTTTRTQIDDPATPEDETGWYYFSELAFGTYVVAEQRVTEWRQSYPEDAGIPLPDLPIQSGLYVVTLSSSHRLEVLDFGNYRWSTAGTASISGVVYVDVDNDGFCDPQEIRLPNVPITIEGPVTRVVTTAADGLYYADGLPPGTYSISETQPYVFNDGRETLGMPPLGSVENDRFVNVALQPNAVASGYNFGEYGLRAQYIGKQLLLASTPPAGVYVAQLLVNGGESLLPLSTPSDGMLRLTASSEGEPQSLQLYDAHWLPVKFSADAQTLSTSVAEDGQFLVYLASGSTTLVTATLDSALPTTPVYVYTNSADPRDVTNDEYVTPRDALVVINALNSAGRRTLTGVNLSPHYLDVNGDRYLSPLDALMVINWLNRQRGAGEGEAEGEEDASKTTFAAYHAVGEITDEVAARPQEVVCTTTSSHIELTVSLDPNPPCLVIGFDKEAARARLRDRTFMEYLIQTDARRKTDIEELLDVLCGKV